MSPTRPYSFCSHPLPPPHTQIPRTLDNTRDLDDTVVAPDDDEVLADEAGDEFSPFFSGSAVPKLMITTRAKPSAQTFPLVAALLSVLPNAFYYKRGRYSLKQVCDWAGEHGFTHVAVLSEKSKVVNGLTLCHLPVGPTAFFKLSSSMLPGAIEGHGTATEHAPEMILNNFTTRLGRRVGRLLGSLWPHNPEFKGRNVVTFHNQRDYLFFRRHRYVFSEDGQRAKLQELGPRFTLKLRWMLAGAFDPKFGDYEFFHKRHFMDKTRRTFHL